jgi:hypothetical protein
MKFRIGDDGAPLLDYLHVAGKKSGVCWQVCQLRRWFAGCYVKHPELVAEFNRKLSIEAARYVASNKS